MTGHGVTAQRTNAANKRTKRVAGQSPAMDIAMNTGHEFVTKKPFDAND